MNNAPGQGSRRFRRRRRESVDAKHAATGREIEEYLLYLRSPWRVMSINFIAGMMRGLGAAVGATAVVALIIWLLAKAVSLPWVGSYFKDAQGEVLSLIEEARFSDDFQRVEALLWQIEKNTADAAAALEDRAAATGSQTADAE